METDNKRILLVHNYYQIPGGEDTVVDNEKQLLEEQGHLVVLYTRHNSELKSFSLLQKLLLPFSTIFNWKTYREVTRLIEKEKIDILHVHNTLNLISPSVYYAGIRKKIPVIQTVHNFRLLCPGATFFREGHICEECLTKGLFTSVKYGCYRNSRFQTLACAVSMMLHRWLGIYKRINYICLTEFNRSKLLQMKQISKERVFVKANFVAKSETIVPFEKRNNQYVYVGRLEKIKGIDVLLRAWKLLGKEGPTLYLCGSGSMEAWVKEYISENKLSNVKQLGFVENHFVKKVIGESKALILPTQVYEGFPMTVVEAYAMGTPVIGSDLGNTGNLIAHGVSGLKFRHDSEEALKEAILEMERKKIELPETYRNKYSKEENYSQLRRIYEACSNYH